MVAGNNEIDDEVVVMTKLDDAYRELSKLSEYRFYRIFYSRISPSPIMILGINPGGDPASWIAPAGADPFCAGWQHDYVDQSYELQSVMLPLLRVRLRMLMGGRSCAA